MPTLTINKQYQDGQIFTEAQLDAALASVTTLINTTGLGADNIQDNSIGPAEIQTSAITETKLASDAISTVKIQDGAVTKAKLAAALQELLVPTGSEMLYAGTSAPSGWLMCDGSAVSRTTYANLFAVIGVEHGSGDGTTTFNVPDARGRFVRFADGSAGRDPDSASRTAMNPGGATGNNVGSVQADSVGAHTHSLRVASAVGGGSGYVVEGGSPVGGNDGSGVIATTGETRPINFYTNLIIKT